MVSKELALVEPGMTIQQLNIHLKKDGLEVPLLVKDQITFEEAI